MRKRYDFSKGRRNPYAARLKRQANDPPGRAEDPPLTPAWSREIKRRVADMRNPVRFMLVSVMSPRFMLFYEVSDGTYVLNNPMGATLFKKRDVAEAVRRVLGSRVRILRCTTKQVRGLRVPIRTGVLSPRKRARR